MLVKANWRVESLFYWGDKISDSGYGFGPWGHACGGPCDSGLPVRGYQPAA